MIRDNQRCCTQSYSMMEGSKDISENLKTDRVTHYVEHPVPIQPPLEEAPAAPMPLMLTQKVLILMCAPLCTGETCVQSYLLSPLLLLWIRLKNASQDLQRMYGTR